MTVVIPPRTESQYARHYVNTIDVRRMVEIFSDSYKIAMTSKKPDTARDRFDLALEAFYQIMSLNPPRELRQPVQEAIEDMVQHFPVQVLMNEAQGIREKALKLKTPKKRAERLMEAKLVIDRAIAEDPKCAPAHVIAAEIENDINKATAAGA